MREAAAGVAPGDPRFQTALPARARRRPSALPAQVIWTRVGRVWAMDFSQAPCPIVGSFTNVFAVRNVASGEQLAALPCVEADTAGVVGTLAGLFAIFGALLVVKGDNGSNLTAAEVTNLLLSNGVLQLRSPIRTPRYNGACEADIGSLKLRADQLAPLAGRPGA